MKMQFKTSMIQFTMLSHADSKPDKDVVLGLGMVV